MFKHKTIISIFFLFVSASFAQDISIRPIIFGIHRTGGELWTVQDKAISLGGWGLSGSLQSGNWHFHTEQILTRFFGLGAIPNNFNPEQSFSWGQNATNTTSEIDIDYSAFTMEWKTETFRAFVGKTSTNLGPAQHSLMLSKKVPAFPQYGFQWQINKRLNYHFLRGELFSGIVDPYASDAAAGIPGTAGVPRKTFMNRYLAAHRLDIALSDNLSIGLSESLVYGGRNVAVIYSLPFMLLYSAEHFFRDQDNLQMSGDITWKPTEKMQLYGALLVDEWKPQYTFDKVNRNWFAWQFGFENDGSIIYNDNFQIEFIWTDHRVYRHKYPINDLYSHDVPVGAWIGPHAQSLIAKYLLPVRSSFLEIEYLYAKRGELTDTMMVDQYRTIKNERFEGETEELNRLSLTFVTELRENWWLEVGINQVDWKNAGFRPAQPLELHDDVNKTSFTLGLYHNFSIPNYRITDILEHIR